MQNNTVATKGQLEFGNSLNHQGAKDAKQKPDDFFVFLARGILGGSNCFYFEKFSMGFQPTSQNWLSVRWLKPNAMNSSGDIPSGS